MPSGKAKKAKEQINRPLDAKIEIKNTVNRQDDQRRHDRQNIADPEIDQEDRISQKQRGKTRQEFFFFGPLPFERPR